MQGRVPKVKLASKTTHGLAWKILAFDSTQIRLVRTNLLDSLAELQGDGGGRPITTGASPVNRSTPGLP